MESKGLSKRVNRLGWGVFFARFLTMGGYTVIQTYGAYIFTDIAGIPYTTASMCMFLVSALCAVIAVFSGATVQRTRSKMGQYRPWIALSSPLILLGGLIMFIKTSNPLLTTVIVTIGYLVPNLILNYSATAEYGMQIKLAGSDTGARNLIASRHWAGSNVSQILVGMLLVPMIAFFGGGNETKGYALTHLTLGIVAVMGTLLDLRISKNYDLPNVGTAQETIEKVSMLDMLKGVFANRPGAMLVLADVIRFTGFYVMFSLMAYQCEYVIGDMMALSYYLTATSFMAVIGNLLAPIVAEKLGGRKKLAYIANILTAACFLVVCFTGKTVWGFVIPNSLAYFFMSFQDTVDNTMYADAGEYYLNKTGKDTRTYIMSMYGLAVKVAISLSSVALGLVLNLINYEPGMVLNDHSATMLTVATGLSPAVCYFIPVILLVIHGVSDKEIERCIKENAEKYDSISE